MAKARRREETVLHDHGRQLGDGLARGQVGGSKGFGGADLIEVLHGVLLGWGWVLEFHSAKAGTGGGVAPELEDIVCGFELRIELAESPVRSFLFEVRAASRSGIQEAVEERLTGNILLIE